MGGRVKTLHPKLYAGLLALRDDDEHMAAAAEHEVEFVDLVCVNLYPFEATAARRGVTEHEVIENIDIGGPTMIRAAAKNFAFAAVVVNPASYDAVLQELTDAGGKLSLGTRESLAAEAFSYTARYDSAISRWFVEKQDDFPGLLHARVREGHRPRVRREPAPARGLLRAVRRAHARALDGAPARRQGAVVQQRAGPQRRAAADAGVRAAGLLDHQAQQPVRGRRRRLDRRGLPRRLRVRPGVRVRRRHLRQPDGRRAVRRGAAQAVLRGPDRAPLHRGGARAARVEAEHARARGRRAAARQRRRARPQARDGRPAGPGPRHGARGPHGDGGRHRAQAERGRVGRDAVRLEGLQARALERDRALQRPRLGRASAPAR